MFRNGAGYLVRIPGGRLIVHPDQIEIRRQEEHDIVEIAVVPESGSARIDGAAVRKRYQDDQNQAQNAGDEPHGAPTIRRGHHPRK